VNVFPTYQSYLEQFETFIRQMPQGGALVYCTTDAELVTLASLIPKGVKAIPYGLPAYTVEDGIAYLEEPDGRVALEIFGKHNLTNLNGSRELCKLLGLTGKQFNEAIASFKGAARRLQVVARKPGCTMYWDFAHSPSKLKATIDAVKEQFPKRKLVACMELHTFSSLTKDFLKEYKDTMAQADVCKVYFNPDTLAHKRLPPLNPDEVKAFFGGNIEVYTNSALMVASLKAMAWKDTNLLLMSSGNFDGVNVKELSQLLVNK